MVFMVVVVAASMFAVLVGLLVVVVLFVFGFVRHGSFLVGSEDPSRKYTLIFFIDQVTYRARRRGLWGRLRKL